VPPEFRAAPAVTAPPLGPGMLPPPEAPPGWRSGPPDYVGVGTIRSGTTWWSYLIRCHPDVAWPPSRRKEVHYFDQFADPSLPVNPGTYYAYFPRPEGMQCGEWTPKYMSDDWTAGLLAQVAPAAKLLVLLRDPVERVISTLTYIEHKFGEKVDSPMVAREVDRSRYGHQLGQLLEHFPTEQLLVLQYERCAADPENQLRRTFEFLGLEPGRLRLRPRHGRSRNPTKWPKFVPGDELTEQFQADLAADLRALAERFPEIDQSLWPSARS
jgi:Sulfotransferase domain